MRFAPLSVLIVVLALAFAPGAGADPPITKQAVAQGSGGAVASDSTYATQAGLSVLRRGGTAADAAVAVASTLGVTAPYSPASAAAATSSTTTPARRCSRSTAARPRRRR